jgi:4-amino-4-deoxy-L-arabinose transferase-like glycosyltransferase
MTEGVGWRPRLAILAVAFAIRIGAIAWIGPQGPGFGDASDYLATAEHVCSAHGYPDRGNLPFFRAPLLPLVIAATTLCHPDRILVVKIVLAACDSGTALVIGEIAWLLFASTRIAVLAALFGAMDPFFVFGVSDVRTEPLFMFLLSLAIWGVLKAIRDGELRSPLLSGIAFALASLARPAGLGALAFAAVSLLFGSGTWRRRWARSGSLVAAGVLTLAPWALRNAARYHELILVNDAAGFSFWTGSHPELDRIARIKEPDEYRRATLSFETDVTAPMAESIAASDRLPRERSHAWFAAALENIRRDPEQAAAFAARRAFRYWRPWLNPQEHGPLAVFGSAAFNVALYSLAAIGLALFARREAFLSAWVVSFFVTIWILHIPNQVVMRFRIPFTDPLLLVFAARAVVFLRCGFVPAAGKGGDKEEAGA